MKFRYNEALTPVLLIKFLYGRLISLKTEIARSVKGPKLQVLHAEDAMAKPYLVLRNLVT